MQAVRHGRISHVWMLDHSLTDILTLDHKHFQRFEELNVVTP